MILFFFYIVPIIIVIFYFKIKNRMLNIKISTINQAISKKDQELTNIITENEIMITNFKNFHQTKLFEIALSYLKLKRYQENIISILDPFTDYELIEELEKNIELIDESLKETALLSPSIINKTNLSVINEIIVDGNFFRN